MKTRIAIVAAALLLTLSAAASAAPTEIKGAAILDHPCGKTAVQHMGLVNAGKMAEAVKLGTKEMQAEWNAMPAEDREMLAGMMKEMSFPSDKFAADIKAGGLLSVDGENATLTVKQEHKEASGTSTSTMTQKYRVSGASCAISK